jgi:hypothetical protein
MKKKALIWILLFALTTLISAAPSFAAPSSVDGFLGISWGATPQEAEQILKQKKGLQSRRIYRIMDGKQDLGRIVICD